MKNKQLSSTFCIYDEETGDIISEGKRSIRIPDTVGFQQRFYKVSQRAIDVLTNYNHLGQFCKLLENIEYDTNRLTISAVGTKSIVIKQTDMAEILGLSTRTVNALVKYLKEKRAIFKIEGAHYINPSFAMRSGYISTEYLEEMLKLDPELKIYLPERVQSTINKLERAELAKWHIDEAEKI